MIDDEMTEEGEGRRWNDHSPRWAGRCGKKDDGFISTLARMASVLWGGSCRVVDIEEV